MGLTKRLVQREFRRGVQRGGQGSLEDVLVIY
jgi:hypothetical protein